jgi:dUTP pyrophosphatase
MEREELENYINKLKELEEDISSDKDVDEKFLTEVNDIMSMLSSNMTESKFKNNQFQDNGFNDSLNDGFLVKVKKLDSNAVIPSYSKDGDAGMDLTITREIENTSFSVTYGFGIAMEIPKHFVGLVFPRSSVRNQDLILSNCVGVIDSGYRGELQATFKKTNGLDSIKYKVGDRGAQIIILPYPKIYMTEVPELSDTERGTGGFGSTGK